MQPNRVCYTEDSMNWPEFVIGGFNHFGFQVDHFESNTDAWTNPQRGIASNPNRFDVFVFDNDTGYQTMEGHEIIQKVLDLPPTDREIVVIILSSSNPAIFSREDFLKLRDEHNVQLCWKPYSFYLQAEYARQRIDEKTSITFKEWLMSTRGIDLEQREGEDLMKKANDELGRQIRRGMAEREGFSGPKEKEI